MHDGGYGRTAAQLIGKAIRRFRERDGLTLEAFASSAGVSYQYLSGIENGKENFSIGILERLAAALDLPVATLVAVAYGHEAPVGFARPLADAE